ncbi:uncharacterized protein LOC130621953 isoform X2 [Hydractinia symbiolongicarpus]|uniref:uncharacterized protein LOC130621953 isoform X2 n=3 Tax=Hydractinia symbiolongicarpus TaxID=13093 RepID=UPI00254B281F|nr:uncharacterized protein LOC130621953 isoform X2 [Hydractinia symbiolongicarpus]
MGIKFPGAAIFGKHGRNRGGPSIMPRNMEEDHQRSSALQATNQAPPHPPLSYTIEMPPSYTAQDNNNTWRRLDSREPLLNNTENNLLPDAPPPYNEVDVNPTAPPYEENDLVYPREPIRTTSYREEEEVKEDIDFFRYSAPCKKIATCIATCLALVTFLILILLLVYGKL